MLQNTPRFHLEKEELRVLLIGYNGANNTGSEARLLAIIDDIRNIIGSDVIITVPTLFPENLRRYVTEDSNLKIKPIPPVFFFAFHRLIKDNDLVLLVEGSCYMDTWSSYLLWAWLWATRCAHIMGKPVMAYAVDAGSLSRRNAELVRREANKTSLIVARTQAAADRIRSWGVTAPLKISADPAFYFQVDRNDTDFFSKEWPEAPRGIVGIAAVDFYRWPVVVKLWGRKKDRYRWPYHFSKSQARKKATEKLVKGLSKIADQVIKEYGRPIALICMEQLDEPIALAIKSEMLYGEKARIFSSRVYNASQLTLLLRSLDLLITSRYHAGVLSLPTQVPQIAIGHDHRLKDFYEDLGIKDELFIPYNSPELLDRLTLCLDSLLQNNNQIREELRAGFKSYQEKAGRNREFLSCLIKAYFSPSGC